MRWHPADVSRDDLLPVLRAVNSAQLTYSTSCAQGFAITMAGPCEAWTVSTWGVAAESASLVERLGPSAP